VWLEEDFYRQLCDAGIPHLAGSECAKGVAADFVKGADLVGTIHGAGTNAFRRKVRVIEHIEILYAELKPPAFGDQEILGELHVPVDGVRQAENILAEVSKRAIDGGIDGAAHFGRLKSGQVEPAHTVHRGATSRRAIRADTRNKGPPVIADASAGKFRALQHCDRAATGGGDDSAQFVVSEQVVDQRTVSAEVGRLPNVGAGKHMGVIKAGGAVVKLVTVWIVQRKCGVSGIKTGDTFAKRKVVETL